jgi:hypothetical protein
MTKKNFMKGEFVFEETLESLQNMKAVKFIGDGSELTGISGGSGSYVTLDQSTPTPVTDGDIVVLTDKTLTYTSGSLTRVDYPSSYYKILAYNIDGTLASVDYNGEHTKSFTYTSGELTGVSIS